MFKRSASFSFISNQGKKPRSPLTWRSAFNAVLAAYEDGSSLRVTLSFGFENGTLKKTVIGLRVYSTAGFPTSNGISFNIEETFIRRYLPSALNEANFKKKSTIDDRTVIIKAVRVRDWSYVPSEHEDQIDGIVYKTVISLGFRKNTFQLQREYELDVIRKLVEQLDVICFITSNLGNNLGEIIFDQFFSVIVLRAIEPDRSKWQKLSTHLLENHEDLVEKVEDVFDFSDDEIKPLVQNNCVAFCVCPEVFKKRFNILTATYALEECLKLNAFERDCVNVFLTIADKK